jgi:hypothetical protein
MYREQHGFGRGFSLAMKTEAYGDYKRVLEYSRGYFYQDEEGQQMKRKFM